MMEDSMLTTIDNPYNPVTDFDAWYAWDEQHGYSTLSYLARVTVTSPDLSEADQSLAIETAMDEIVLLNGGLYKKVPITPQPTTDI